MHILQEEDEREEYQEAREIVQVERGARPAGSGGVQILLAGDGRVKYLEAREIVQGEPLGPLSEPWEFRPQLVVVATTRLFHLENQTVFLSFLMSDIVSQSEVLQFCLLYKT